MGPDQTARMRRLVWIHADRKRTMLVLSWRDSFNETALCDITEEYCLTVGYIKLCIRNVILLNITLCTLRKVQEKYFITI
jgi:hypothetical protein